MNVNEGDTIMVVTETHVLVVGIQSIKLRNEFDDSMLVPGPLVAIDTKTKMKRA